MIETHSDKDKNPAASKNVRVHHKNQMSVGQMTERVCLGGLGVSRHLPETRDRTDNTIAPVFTHLCSELDTGESDGGYENETPHSRVEPCVCIGGTASEASW